MNATWKIGFLVLWATIALPFVASSTKEFLDCRANLTAAIRNDTTFMRQVRQADYIFTGKIKDLRNDRLHVRVKRAIKGVLNATLDITLNDTCSHYIRRSYTGIFMARRDPAIGDPRHVNRIVMHFGPVPLTLANLDRLNAAVKGKCPYLFLTFTCSVSITRFVPFPDNWISLVQYMLGDAHTNHARNEVRIENAANGTRNK